MRTRRVTVPAMGVMAAVALAVSGCSADDAAAPGSTVGTPAPSASSAAADPAAASALGTAAATLGNTSFKVSLTAGSGVKVVGTIDAPNGRGTADLTATGSNTDLAVQTRLDGQDLYVQVPGITKAGTWTRIDVSRLPEGANVGLRPGQIDPANTAQLLGSTTDVRQTGSRSYAGTLDLTKVAGVTGLDEQGRLSELTIQLPAVNGQPAQPLEVLYTDYGIAVGDLTPDPATVVEAPANLYTTLGGK
jgi:hypothetical protein